MTLRRRLVVALAAAALIVAGSIVAVLVTLHTSQRDELDKQLFAATRELLERTGPVQGAPSSGAPAHLPDLSVGDLASGGAESAVVGPAPGSGGLPWLAPTVANAHATDRSAPFKPFDVVANGNRHYRVDAVRVGDGRIVVAAVSTEHIDATFRRVALGSAVAGLALLAALALLAWWVEHLGLRPIQRMAAAAEAISCGETTRRVDAPPAGTEAGHLARAFNMMVDQRQAIEERLRRFVADASHELRTPLTTVAGVLDLFDSGSLAGPELDDAMRRARSETRRMTSLVEDLLLLTLLDHAPPLADDEVDLAGAVRDAAVDVGVVQPERPVSVEVPDTAVVRGDEARLRQVIGNLVSNALTHTPGSAALHLAVHTEHDAYVVEVRDEGPGLTAEQADHVFDRFYRIAPGRSRRRGGTGLGLSIVQSVVAAHHGQVSLTTAPGRGCCFRAALPRRIPANLQDSEQARQGWPATVAT
jgi:two-component system OmpR family sensor kinase